METTKPLSVNIDIIRGLSAKYWNYKRFMCFYWYYTNSQIKKKLSAIYSFFIELIDSKLVFFFSHFLFCCYIFFLFLVLKKKKKICSASRLVYYVFEIHSVYIYEISYVFTKPMYLRNYTMCLQNSLCISKINSVKKSK